ncbi:MAG TPA: hypothetical protein PLV87_12035 [Opitutaceae bacterium]|nr:hypothetical protein [Opitutaceae bacterium]
MKIPKEQVGSSGIATDRPSGVLKRLHNEHPWSDGTIKGNGVNVGRST